MNPIFQMIENSSDAYVIFLAATKEIVYTNKLAEKHFILTSQRANKDFFERIEAQFERREIAVFPNTPMRSTSDTTIYCNVEGGYLDVSKNHIWGRITPISSDIHVKRVMETTDSELIYLEAVPRLYHDILFRLNPKTKRLTHAGELFLQFGLPREMENFPQFMLDAHALHPDDEANFLEYGTQLLEGNTGVISVRIKLIDDTYEWFSVESTAVKDLNGDLLEVLGKITNIQVNKQLEEEASVDALSNTLNANAFEKNVLASLKGQSSAFVTVDIDDFKYINDTFGHNFGDLVISEIGARLNQCVLTTDYVGRTMGDRFVLFYQNVEDMSALEKKVKSILTTISKPIASKQNSHTLSVSMGISMYPQDGTTFEALSTKAQIALKNAKEKGKNVASCFAEEGKEQYLIAVLEEEQRYHNALEMLDRSTSAFVVFHKDTHEIMSENAKARDMFYDESGLFPVTKVFGSEEKVGELITKVTDELVKTNLAIIEDEEVIQNNGKCISCDLEFSYISDDHIYVYLKFTPKNDKKVTLLKTLIEKNKNPVVVVYKDEDLTISYGNTLFYSDCGCTEDNFEGRYGSTLKDLFLPEKQELFMGIIWRTMRSKEKGYIKTALQLANGEVRWLYFDMTKLKMMDSDKKIYCQLMLEDEEAEGN